MQILTFLLFVTVGCGRGDGDDTGGVSTDIDTGEPHDTGGDTSGSDTTTDTGPSSDDAWPPDTGPCATADTTLRPDAWKGGVLEEASLTLRGSEGTEPRHMAFAGDIDGDGLEDMVVTASHASRIWVVPGETRGEVFLDDVGVVLSGETTDDEAGEWLTTGFDANEDGLADLVVGATEATNSGDWAGAAYLILDLTTDGDLGDADLIVRGEPGDVLGALSPTVGDLDRDGELDLAVGAPGAGSQGRVYLFGADTRGSVTGSDARVEVAGSDDAYGFGWTLGVLDDATGDGWNDLAVQSGWYGCDLHLFDDLSGTGEITTQDATSLALGSDGCIDGLGVVPLGDVDGDGLTDLVARHNYDRYYTAPVIVLPKEDGAQMASISSHTYDPSYLGLGPAGDVNGDGHTDLLVGDPHASAISEFSGQVFRKTAGKTALFHGPIAAHLSMADAPVELLGAAGGDRSGTRVTGGGDATGEGTPDLLVLAPYACGLGGVYLVPGEELAGR